MPRGRRLKLRTAEERYKSYEAGVETGSLKYEKKLPLMRLHYTGVAKFEAEVNKIVASVLDEANIVGLDRGIYQGASMRIARYLVKYRNVSEDYLAALAEMLIAEMAVKTGVVGTPQEQEFINIMRMIAGKILAARHDLYRLYSEGYEGIAEEKVGGGGGE